MSPKEETILDTRLKGITWRVVGSILGGAAGIIFFGFKAYMGIISAINQNSSNNQILRQDVTYLKESSERHERQIQFLLTKEKQDD